MTDKITKVTKKPLKQTNKQKKTCSFFLDTFYINFYLCFFNICFVFLVKGGVLEVHVTQVCISTLFGIYILETHYGKVKCKCRTASQDLSSSSGISGYENTTNMNKKLQISGLKSVQEAQTTL